MLPPKLEGQLLLWVRLKIQKPKTTKLLSPRGDIDNYLKLLMDCCNNIVWNDDVQVVKICATKEFSKTSGSIDFWVKELTNETLQTTQPENVDLESLKKQGFNFCDGSVITLSNQ